jgi:peroxiredoxin Q/BCP
MGLATGSTAPAFALKDAKGKTVALTDFRGSDVIVYFYPKDDTPGCTKEAQGFRDLWTKIKKRGAVVIGISPDDGASHAQFSSKHRLPFILLSDPDREVMARYGAYGEKVLYGKKTKGVIRSTVWVGADGKVRKHWARVASAAEHPAEVLAALVEGA